MEIYANPLKNKINGTISEVESICRCYNRYEDYTIDTTFVPSKLIATLEEQKQRTKISSEQFLKDSEETIELVRKLESEMYQVLKSALNSS